jgi:hypothetical protein
MIPKFPPSYFLGSKVMTPRTSTNFLLLDRPRNATLSALLRGRVCVNESEVEKMKVLGFQI